MSFYNTGNPVPSMDPRDLDDNAKVFDNLLDSSASSVPDRLGVPRKTWHQIEIDASALVSPNVASLAGLTLAANKGLYATAPNTLALFDFTPQARQLMDDTSFPSMLVTLGAAARGPNSDITSLTGLTTPLSAAQGGTGNTTNLAATSTALATSRSITATGDASWTVNFNGTANVTAALTLASVGTAGTYGSVTTDAKGRVTSGSTATPIANGGTAATTATAAGTNLGTSTVGTNTDQLARSSMIQNEIANKRAWTSYTPTVTALTGTFTASTATGSYMVVFGICFFRVAVTITTVGTGVKPIFTLPFPALAGHTFDPMPALETAVNGKTGVSFIRAGLTTAETRDYANADLITANGCVIVTAGSYPIA